MANQIRILTAGTFSDGSSLLCFSLKQVQYLQYYIHAMGLTDPAHPANKDITEAAGKEAGSPGIDMEAEEKVAGSSSNKEAEKAGSPPSKDHYVPLPSTFILHSMFTSVEPVWVSLPA